MAPKSAIHLASKSCPIPLVAASYIRAFIFAFVPTLLNSVLVERITATIKVETYEKDFYRWQPKILVFLAAIVATVFGSLYTFAFLSRLTCVLIGNSLSFVGGLVR
ncbi:unnamed protein product, partial [Mesorhabditis belari]|uniref:Uncharacterized protein n=1 Tax=Mesorhabditis belari TaxID=2138241 RepID=A0AAF3EHF7_9BILA